MEMRRILLSALAVMQVLSLSAQSEQKVQVLEYKGASGKAPMNEVALTVTNAASAMSDAQGEMTLRFRTLKPGDKVTIRRIDRVGYEIFNKQAIEQWAISPAHPFQLILCASDRLKSLQDQYMSVASASYAKQLKKEQARLAAERKKNRLKEEEYQTQLQQLQDEYDQQLEDLENYVDHFSRIDLSELTGEQQKLISLVQQGKIDEAIARYEKGDYLGKYEKECREIEEIANAQQRLAQIEEEKRQQREAVRQAIGRQIATYRLAGGRENFAKVTNLLKQVADADTTQLDAVWEYAEHAMNQHMESEALHYFGIYLRATQNDPPRQAHAWSRIANTWQLQRNHTETINAELKALSIYQQLYDAEQEKSAGDTRYLPQLALVYRQLCHSYVTQARFEEASKILPKTLELFGKLSESDAEAYLGIMATLYCYQGMTYANLGDTDAALHSCEQGHEMASKHYDGSDGSLAQLGWSLSMLGELCYMKQDWEALARYQMEYVERYEEHYRKNPQAYALYLLSGCNNLAEAYLHLKDYGKCEENVLRTEKMIQEMREGRPAEFMASDLFNLCDIAAHLYQEKGDPEKQQHYVRLALEMYDLMPAPEQANGKDLYEALKQMQ